MKTDKGVQSQLVLAISAELAAMVMTELVGNELASSINGSELKRRELHNMAMTSTQAYFNSNSGAK